MTVLTADSFAPLGGGWGSPREIEVRRRIHISVLTYAYEIADAPLVDDYYWDQLAQRIDKSIGTGHPMLDEFFVAQFSPMTGMWIHQHPELAGIKRIHDRYRTLVVDHYGRKTR